MRMNYFFTLSVFSIGALALVLPSGYSWGFYPLCFVSLILWLTQKRPRDSLSLDSKTFLWPIGLYALGQMALALYERWTAHPLGEYLPFLLLEFGVWGIRRYKPHAHWFWAGLAVGAIGACALAGYQALVLEMRAQGYTNAIQFGNIALLLGTLCMVRALVVFRLDGLNILLWLGFIAGLGASVFSLSRGGWLAVGLIFIWIGLNATRGLSTRKRGAAALAVLLILLIPALQPQGIVQTRIQQASEEVQAFLQTGQSDTSVGARLAMWTVALEGIAAAPLLGQGDLGWVKTRDAAIESGRLSAIAADFSHVHNEYLNVWFKRGLLGLALYLALYLVPMLWFFKPHLQDTRPEVRALAMAGMVIPMMFMDFGLTQTFLSHNSGRVVLCGLWMAVAALLLIELKSKASSRF